jgi:hypothetical protein
MKSMKCILTVALIFIMAAPAFANNNCIKRKKNKWLLTIEKVVNIDASVQVNNK